MFWRKMLYCTCLAARAAGVLVSGAGWLNDLGRLAALAAPRAPVSSLANGLDGLDISGRLAEPPGLPLGTLAMRLARPFVFFGGA